MPEYAGFSTALISQYDAATIPEDHVRLVTTPSLRFLHLDDPTRTFDSPGLSQQHPDKTLSDLQHKTDATVVEAYIPVYRSSQFWICYECPPPPERDEDEDADQDEVKYYYFKLFVSGRCVLSWGVGGKERWRGKSIFGLFDGGRDFEGRRIVEKRGLFFSSAGARDADAFEIRIFRAKGRRSETVRYQGLSEVVGGGEGRKGCCSLDFTSVGKLQSGEQRRYYTYALLDAKHEPYFTFRYKFEVDEDEMPRMESAFLSIDIKDTTTTTAVELAKSEGAQGEQTESSLWSGLEHNTPPSHPSTADDDGKTETIRRLSFPPRNMLHPHTSRAENSSPIKQQQQASTSDDDLVRRRGSQDPEYSIAIREAPFSRRAMTGLRKPEWTAVRTASPLMESKEEEEVTAALSAHRKSVSSGSSGLLRSVVASALRRRDERGR